MLYCCNYEQEWIPFPAEWLSRGLIVTDQTNCTEDDVCSIIYFLIFILVVFAFQLR